MMKLLEYCGFETSEIESELPRVQKAFAKLGITTEDIEQGKKRLVKYYDMELMGLRKIFRLCLKELVNSLLLKEEGKQKIIYGFMAPGINVLGSAFMSQSKEIFCIHHSWALHIVLGCIFGKLVPLLEAAEEKWLKDGIVSHCANVKSLLGPIVMNLIPKPDLLVTAGHLCEISPKTLDLMHELYDIPIHVHDTCQDREIESYASDTKRIVELGAKSFKNLAERIEAITGVELTTDQLWQAVAARDRLVNNLDKLKLLISESDPLLLSATHQNILGCLMHLTLDMDAYNEAFDAVDILYKELHERAEMGKGAVEKGAPRILAMLPAGQTDPRLEHLACDVGLALVVQDTGFQVPYGVKPEDPYTAVIGNMGGSLHTTLARRIPLIIEGCKKNRIDGILDRYHVGCRTVAADALIIKEEVTKALGIPVLLLEWENFDPRAYDHNEFKKKLEVFKTMILANKSN